MAENKETPKSLFEEFHLRPFTISTLSEGLRAWVTIAATFAAISFVVCTIVSGILLVRLGWDALWEAPPVNQEVIS
ncbi:MAG: hypothetical protein WBE90_00115, partial [Xanthobacteraceae bacterium]